MLVQVIYISKRRLIEMYIVKSNKKTSYRILKQTNMTAEYTKIARTYGVHIAVIPSMHA